MTFSERTVWGFEHRQWLGDSGRRVSLSGLSKKAVYSYENPPLRYHILVRLVGILK